MDVLSPLRSAVLKTKTVSAATYTLSNADSGQVLEFTAACTVTVPVGLAPGFNVTLVQDGAGAVTVQGDGTSVIKSNGGYTQLGGDGAFAGLAQSATADTYYFYGDRV